MYRAAARVEAVQGVEEALGLGDLLPLAGESIVAAPRRQPLRERSGLGQVTTDVPEGAVHAGDLDLQLNYGMLNALATALLGSVSQTNLPGGLKSRIHTPGAMRTLTVGVDRRLTVWAYRGCAVDGLDLAFRVGRPATGGARLSAGAVDAASGQNPALWKPPAGNVDHAVRGQDARVRLAPFSAVTPLGAGDAINMLGGRCRIGWDVASGPDRYSLGGRRAANRTAPEAEGRLELARHEDDLLHAAALSGATWMMDWTFTGPEKTSPGSNLKLIVRFGAVTFVGGPQAGGVELIRPTFAFRATKPPAVPAGFPSADAVSLELIY